MRCKKCGEKLKGNEKFCTVCGYYNSRDNDTKEDEIEKGFDNLPISDSLLPDDDDDENLLFEDDDDFFEKKESEETEEMGDINPKQEEKKSRKKTKKEKTKAKDKEEDYYYLDDKLLETYIGEDYKLISEKVFNIYAFFLNWMYVIYRKMYLIGIIGMLLTVLLIFNRPKYLIIYLLVIMLFVGLAFNKTYIFISKARIKHMRKKEEDSFILEEKCQKKGGVNTPIALIIYSIFLIGIFFCFFDLSFNRRSKFWEENGANNASCYSLLKTASHGLEQLENKTPIDEGLCIIDKSKSIDYHIYLKLKDIKGVYVYYKTEDEYLTFQNDTKRLSYLETKSLKEVLSDEESAELKEKKAIAEAYTEGIKKAKLEDELIKRGKDTSEKKYYIFTKEEILR